MNALKLLYQGKAKSAYLTEDHDLLVLKFRDDTSAFDGEIIEQLSEKGAINNQLNAFIMNKLSENGVPTHYVERLSATDALVKRLDMIPVECVVRNRAAGSIVRRLGIEEGMAFDQPLFELFLKNDTLHDPMVTEHHVEAFGWATHHEMSRMYELTLQTNTILKAIFDQAGLQLVDFKLEFGRFHGEIVLGDEFSPDGCRLWDKVTGESKDKDRFRQNLGGVLEAYREVAGRLGIVLEN
ncbi:MAG TPA: phosphoribosylaminoimidazolesuccinocarboxamide synthase [Gammaproteobacteria bacterium]|nr:phosphoribosylaminoimidazolesuccinocarboxamide synthase [Gammaproteobacteria bacterium]